MSWVIWTSSDCCMYLHFLRMCLPHQKCVCVSRHAIKSCLIRSPRRKRSSNVALFQQRSCWKSALLQSSISNEVICVFFSKYFILLKFLNYFCSPPHICLRIFYKDILQVANDVFSVVFFEMSKISKITSTPRKQNIKYSYWATQISPQSNGRTLGIFGM